MTRSTQYVGLTNRAKAWLKSINAQRVIGSSNKTFGMFEEDVPLGEWTNPGDERMSIREVLVASPWSSGPMLLTALEVRMSHCHPNGCPTIYFNWTLDPLVENEVDEEFGAYWI